MRLNAWLLSISLLFVGLVTLPRSSSLSAQSPHIEKRGGTEQLIVDGKPFLILGGELHNSSSSSLEYMKPLWPKLAGMGLNTVITPLSWELIEPLIRPKTYLFSQTGLVWLENTHNMAGGSVHPLASALIFWQRYFYFPGPLLALALLGGFGASIGRTRGFVRRLGAEGVLFSSCATLLLLVPVATVVFDYRFLVPPCRKGQNPTRPAQARKALVVEEPVDLLQFGPQHLGVAEIGVPLLRSRVHFEDHGEHCRCS